ncbi:putative pyridoxal-dependent decarboxylase domain-containing protein 2 [Diaphorina citri]|uniref:Pyridoxal-dependent decarboxylase domain-containing protein 1 n=1 Tax=Diaphorina citri TaxID=121845 RepID=A0A1S3D0A6_DIACI|nr:putative pyridoxal-dependent decarboxylase domain-containing protein 2 [Diaphorina citri]
MTEIFNNAIVNGEDPAKVVEVQQPVEGIEFQVSSVLNRLEEASECHPGDETGPQFESFKQHMFNQQESKTFPATSTQDVLNIIQDLFIVEESSDEEEPGVITVLPKLNDVAKLTLTSHSLVAYCKLLNNDHAVKISNKIHVDTCNLLNTLFRTNYPGAFFSQNTLEGIVKIFRLLLVTKYPHYNEEGFEAIRNKYPVIYVSHDAAMLVAQYICKQLSLPMYCIRRVPTDPSTPSVQKIDPGELETNVKEDAAAGKLPFFVLAEVGSSLNGHVDNVSLLQEICAKYNLWLHLRGHNLSSLALNSHSPSPLQPGHSVSLPLGTWLNLPSLPTVTLFTNIGDDLSTPLSMQTNEKAIALPVWTTLKSMGQTGIQDILTFNFSLVESIRQKLSEYPCLRILSHGPVSGLGLKEVTSQYLPVQTILESVQSCVVFQFVPKDAGWGPVPAYYDKLNSWLGQILQRDVPSVSLNLTETAAFGTVLRICPFECSSGGDYESFLVCLDAQVDILQATVAHKASFISLVEASPKLTLVDMPGWAGLGGVRYVPPAWGATDTDQAKAELNRLNIQVVRTLRTSDAAFSLGEGTDGLACVRFGMVTAETDITELLSLVEETGQQEEESWKFIDSMAELKVFVQCSLVNWWSPVDKDPTRVKGRTLDLTAGRIETTENIYKYHAQATPTTTPTPQLTPQLTPPVGGEDKSPSPPPPSEPSPEQA